MLAAPVATDSTSARPHPAFDILCEVELKDRRCNKWEAFPSCRMSTRPETLAETGLLTRKFFSNVLEKG